MNYPWPQSPSQDNLYIAQGEFAVGNRPETVVSTILGSCVAVCLWDPAARLGGMNHILLPGDADGRLGANNFGASDMERLLNALLKLGAVRERLRAKAFGGASIVAGLSDVGARNARFVRGFLQVEAIPCLAESLGGGRARQVRFWPHSGRVQHRFLNGIEVVPPAPVLTRRGNDVELFD